LKKRQRKKVIKKEGDGYLKLLRAGHKLLRQGSAPETSFLVDYQTYQNLERLIKNKAP
jgi:hypothetical protein